MSKKPSVSKPKPKPLPKKRPSLGRNFNEQSKDAIRSLLATNFGVLGKAIAKTYIPNTPKTVKPNKNAPQAVQTDIRKKTVDRNSDAIQSILTSSNNVTSAISTVSINSTRSFAVATKQAIEMGDQISLGLRNVNAELDKLLFKGRKNDQTSPLSGLTTNRTSASTKGNEPTPPDNPSIFDFFTKRSSKAKAPKVKSFKSRIFGGLGKLTTILSILSQGSEAYDEYQESGNAGRAASGFAGGVGGTVGGAYGGAAAGAALGSIVPGLGTAAGGLIGSIAGSLGGSYFGRKIGHSAYDKLTENGSKYEIGTNGDILYKMKFEAESIKFSANEYIMFSSKTQNAHSGNKQSVGTLNRLYDRLSGGPGGPGMFNTLANKIFGIGGPQNTPSGKQSSTPGTESTPSTPDINYNGPDKGQYDSLKARPNFMQPGPEFGGPGENLTSVTTEGGHKFTVNKASAEPFKRTIESLEQAGAPIGTIGGYSPRPGGIAGTGRMSQHSMGNAMDIGSQTDRDVVSPAFRKWIDDHPKEFRSILNQNGMVSGGDWKNPDLGHLEWSGRKPWIEKEQLEQANKKQGEPEQTKKDAAASPSTAQPLGSFKFGDDDALPRSMQSPTPEWAKDGRWKWMRRSKNVDNRTTNDLTPYMTDADSTKMKEKGFNDWIDTWDKTTQPNPLAAALGGKTLAEQIKPFSDDDETHKSVEMQQWNSLEQKSKLTPPPPTIRNNVPRTENKALNNQTSKQFFDVNTNDLDHRPKQEAVPREKFDDYMSTTSGMEDSN